MIKISDAYRNHATLSVYWGIRALLVFAVFYFLWEGDPASAGSTFLILLFLLAPSVLKRKYQVYLPFALELGITVFVFLTLFLGHIARFYERVPFWDKFLHFQSGFLLGATGYVLVYILNENKRSKLDLSPGFISLFAVTFSLSIGAIWEIWEFAADVFYGGNYWQANGIDTMWDIIADFVGALIVSISGYFWMHRHKRLPFTPRLLRMFDRTKEKIKQKISF